jgi:SAM-dependent methyltransferase
MLLPSTTYDDAARLRDFYASPLGQLARRMIARRIRERWTDVSGMEVIGLGFASPYLRMFQGEAKLTAALMPQNQGVVQWPHGGPYRAALVPGIELPLRDNSVERVLVVHGLEHVEARLDYLREIWRVLMPQGRVIIAVPNRRGAWAALETTPFGHGRPYSVSQIQKQLREAMLEPVGVAPCLFAPPLRARALPWAALAWERIGSRLWPAFAGIVTVEAIKQVYADIPVPVKKTAFVPVPSLTGLSPARRKSAQ